MAKPIKIVILGDAAGLSRTLNKSAAELDTFAARAQRTSRRIVSSGASTIAAGKAISKGVTLPILAVVGAAGKMAVDFQAKMNLLHTAAGDSQRNTKKISDGILGIAKSTGISLEQLEEGAYVVDKSLSDMKGPARARKAIEMLRAASQGAVAEGTDLATMTDALSTVMKDYGDKLGSPVQATNALIAASGLSKTTMQTFVGSLSNVLPLAARLGIGFDEIGGAVATMSQHGVTAERATDNLNNAIRNLAAPNRVAQQEMQQLGINVTDLQANLGKRGLKGTFDLLTDAMQKHFGPAGLVALDTFRKSTSMAAGATKMLGAMPAAAKKVSLAYRDGTLSLDDWRKAVKALDPQSASLAKQYATLEDKARGYNQALRQGDPQQQAAVEALKKMTGGATGLNTILMLTGDYEKSFAANTKEIGDKAKKSGKDIETWASTQKLAKTQLAQLKETLVTAAVKLGQALIPAIKDAVTAAQPFIDMIANWAQKFHDADPATQQMIIKIALFAAAVGPAVTVVGKLIKVVGTLYGAGAKVAMFATASVLSMSRIVAGVARANISIAGMQTRSYSVGLFIRRVFSGIATAAMAMGRYVGTAFKNAGSALAGIPAATKAASGFGGKLSAIGSGAASAGAALGPLALGLAGATAVLGAGMYAWNQYQDAQAQAKQETQDLTAAIQQDSGALGVNTRAAVVNVLQKRGMLDAARTLGINTKTLTDAYMGNSAAMTSMQAQLAGMQVQFGSSAEHSDKWSQALHSMNVQFGQVGTEVNNAKSNAAAYAQALGNTKVVTEQTKSATERLAESLDHLDGGALSRAEALLNFRQSLQSVSEAVKQNGSAVRGNTAAALANRQAIFYALDAAKQHAQTLQQQGKSAKAVKAALADDVNALIDTAKHAGVSETAFRGLLRQMGLTPKQIETTIDADTKPAKKAAADAQGVIDGVKQKYAVPLSAQNAELQRSITIAQGYIDALRQNKIPNIDVHTDKGRTLLRDLQRQLDELRDKVVTVTVRQTGDGVTAVTSGPGGTKHQGVTARATGGAVSGPGGPTGDGIDAKLSDGEHVLTASDVRKAGGQSAIYRMRASIQAGVLKFANGGAVTTVKGKNGHTYYRWNGHNYTSIDEARSAQQTKLHDSVSNPIGNIGSAPSSPIDISSTGITRVRAQIAAASKALQQAIAKGLSAGAAASFRKQIHDLRDEATRQLGALRVKIKTTDMADIRKAMSGTADDLRSAFSQILGDSKAAGASKKRLAELVTLEKSLLALQTGRAQIVAKLAKDTSKLADVQSQWNDVKSGVAGAAQGGFSALNAATTTTTSTGPALVANGTTPLTPQGASTTTTKSGGILASLKAQVVKVKAFAANLKKLVAKRVPLSIINEIANAGPIDGADAIKELLSYDGKQLDALRNQSALLTKYSNAAGTTVADANHGTALAKAKKDVADDQAWKQRVDNAISGLVNPPKPGKHAPAKGHKGHVDGRTTNHITVNVKNARATPQEIARELGFALRTAGK